MKAMTSTEFEQNLDRLAEVAVRAGLGLAPGQELVMTATLDASRWRGASPSMPIKRAPRWSPRCLPTRSRRCFAFATARTPASTPPPSWLYEGMAQAFRSGAARLAITGNDPSLLSQEDPEKVSRVNRAISKAYRPALELIVRHEINWTIVACATPAWAAAVFPDLPQDEALARLWDAIFAASRADQPDPVAAWKEHDANLHARADRLNEKRYSALHFRGPGTDLRVGLADDHLWLGGGTTAGNGRYCIPNMPTEEVFTTPHKDRVEGHVTSTKPLSYQGTMIEEISVRFRGRKDCGGSCRARRASLAADDRDRRRSAAARRSFSGAALVADCVERIALHEHAFRRERRLPHRPGAGLQHVPEGWRQPHSGTTGGARRKHSLIHVDWMIGSND